MKSEHCMKRCKKYSGEKQYDSLLVSIGSVQGGFLNLVCLYLPVSLRSDFTEGIQPYIWYLLIDCK